MVGALAGSGWVPIPVEKFTGVLKEVIPAKILPVNQKAFQLGVDNIRK